MSIYLQQNIQSIPKRSLPFPAVQTTSPLSMTPSVTPVDLPDPNLQVVQKSYSYIPLQHPPPPP